MNRFPSQFQCSRSPFLAVSEIGRSKDRPYGRGRFSFLFIAVVLALTSFASALPARQTAAQEPPAALRGRVIDTSGAVISGAEVTLRLLSAGAERRTRTDDEGRFLFAAPGRGVYEVEAHFRGFSAGRHEVRYGGGVQEVEIQLAPASVRQELLVTAERVVGTPEILERHPGCADLIDPMTMTQTHPFTIDEALRKVAGVNTRGEEGFGLRPNIGIRGLNPTRSSQVLLLEDGLPLAYAPYGDNASYYHPPVDRFSSVEIIKGGGQILYGPRTVGAVVNYVTPPTPDKFGGLLTLSGGNRDYLNGHGRMGGRYRGTGLLLDWLRKQGRGARENLRHGVNDLNFKTNSMLTLRQVLGVRFNYYSEDSQVTYSGLRQSEFDADPRANPFRNDRFTSGRYAVALRHSWTPSASWLLNTAAYGTVFSRDWWRQSSNSNQRPTDAANPNCGGMANLDTTCGIQGRLRDYYTWGVESRARVAHRLFGAQSEADFGVRFHFENQERRQKNGATPTARDGLLVENNLRQARAVSFYVQNSFRAGRWNFAPGVRVEKIHYDRTNRLALGGAGVSGEQDLTVPVPGMGLSYAPSEKFTFFAGVHRGFAPPRVEDVISNAGVSVDLDPELSWNYEVGFRSRLVRALKVDFALFRMDFQNQIIPSSVAGGVGATLTNAGETLHQGIELSWQADWNQAFWSRHRVFWKGAYTWLPVARYEGVRYSNIPGFGNVLVTGHRLPYAPKKLLTTSVGFVHARGFNALVESVYTGRQFGDDLNTVVGTPDGQRGVLPGNAIWNVTFNYPVEAMRTTFYVSVKNAFDRLAIVDRTRGILPNAPRLVQAGVTWTF
jgi:Fe(3+) dicitrate transport protein